MMGFALLNPSYSLSPLLGFSLISIEIDFDLGGQPFESVDCKCWDLRRVCAGLAVPKTRDTPLQAPICDQFVKPGGTIPVIFKDQLE
jgi:hypothetical protein